MENGLKGLAMMGILRTGLAAAALCTLGAGGALASTIDFTDVRSYTAGAGSATGTIDGIGWTLTPNGGSLTYTNYDGTSAPVGSLAFENDGVGIGDDEVDYRSESLTLTFASSVLLSGLNFLDLFGFESVRVLADGNFLTEVAATAGAFDNSQGGYVAAALQAIQVTTLTFMAGPNNDIGPLGFGNPDFALAGVTVSPVPLPAGGLLLLSALGGLVIARRRKAAV
jgi:hypothetical protein